MNVYPLCLRRNQSRGSNSNAGKMAQTWPGQTPWLDLHWTSHFFKMFHRRKLRICPWALVWVFMSCSDHKNPNLQFGVILKAINWEHGRGNYEYQKQNNLSLPQMIALVSQQIMLMRQEIIEHWDLIMPIWEKIMPMREKLMHKSLNDKRFLPTCHPIGVFLRPVSQKYPQKEMQIFSYYASGHNLKLDNLGCKHSGLILSGVVISYRKNGYWAFNSLCCVDIDSHFWRCLFLYGLSVCVCCLWDRTDHKTWHTI